MKGKEVIQKVKQALEDSPVPLQYGDIWTHTQKIIAYSLEITISELLLLAEQEFTVEEIQKIEKVLQRRLQGEPLQYILGQEWFWNSEFLVGPGVLIPRRETELLIEKFLTQEPTSTKDLKVAELGIGTGNIALSLLLERKDQNIEWFGFELSSSAFLYAEKNKEKLLVPPIFDAKKKKEQCHFFCGDFFILAEHYGPYDWLIANPPYVPEKDLFSLSKEVQQEPRSALAAGKDGLFFIQKLAEWGKKNLKQKAKLLLEIDSSQEKTAAAQLKNLGYNNIELLFDLQGLPRGVFAQQNKTE